MSEKIEENPYVLQFTDEKTGKEVFAVMNNGTVRYKGGETTAPQDVIDGLKMMINSWRIKLLKDKDVQEAMERSKCETEKLN